MKEDWLKESWLKGVKRTGGTVPQNLPDYWGGTIPLNWPLLASKSREYRLGFSHGIRDYRQFQRHNDFQKASPPHWESSRCQPW